jgi:hypothetical protein
MTALWVVVAALTAGLVFLTLVLAGAVRRLDDLRREVQATNALVAGLTPAETEHVASGLPVGVPAPAFEARRLDGAPFSSSIMAGSRHLVAFVDPGCVACDGLVPDLLRAAAAGEVPPAALVAPAADAWPERWGAGDADRAVVLRDDGAVLDGFRVGFTPQIFVLDEGGAVAAQGAADGMSAVRSLLREAEELRIVVPGTDDA